MTQAGNQRTPRVRVALGLACIACVSLTLCSCRSIVPVKASVEGEELPRILTSLNDETNAVRGVVAKFNLQVLLKASNGQHWRLRGDGTFRAAGLDEPGLPSTRVEFELRSTEEAM